MHSATVSPSRHVIDPAIVLAVVEGEDVVAVATQTLDLRPAMTYSSARLTAGELTVRTDRPVRLTVARTLPAQRGGVDALAGLAGAEAVDVRLEWGHFVVACDGEPVLDRIAPARLRIVRMPGWPVAAPQDATGR